jgi:hypothetical protein
LKKEVKILRAKAVDSLILSIELFNRPSDAGRTHSVLILLDHAFEMLFKATILHRGGRIREPRAKQTIGFDAVVRKGLSDAKVKFLSENQALTVQMINSLRDASQHHILDISEQHLYIQAQAGLSLFRDVFKSVFSEEIQDYLPVRVLPLSTTPPTDLATLFGNEVQEIRKLLAPRVRRHTEAEAKLRSLAIVEKSLNGEKVQPSIVELQRLSREVVAGRKSWDEIFPGVASVTLTAKGYGPSIDLRITKTGSPVSLVKEGTPGATIVAVRRVDELGYYNLGRDSVAKAVGLSGPQATAIIRFLNIQKSIKMIRETLKKTSIEQIWRTHGIRGKR